MKVPAENVTESVEITKLGIDVLEELIQWCQSSGEGSPIAMFVHELGLSDLYFAYTGPEMELAVLKALGRLVNGEGEVAKAICGGFPQIREHVETVKSLGFQHYIATANAIWDYRTDHLTQGDGDITKGDLATSVAQTLQHPDAALLAFQKQLKEVAPHLGPKGRYTKPREEVTVGDKDALERLGIKSFTDRWTY